MKLRPLLWLVLVSQITLLTIEVVTHYDTGSRQTALVMTNIISAAAVFWANRWLGKRGSQLSAVTILLVIGAVWLDALGNFQHLYAGFWWWDRITHTVGGMAISAGFIDFYQAWRRTGAFPVSWGQATWLGFLVGQFLGAMYEVSEWLGDFWFHTHRVVYTYDTPHDLFFNLCGGVIVILIVRFSQRKKSQGNP